MPRNNPAAALLCVGLLAALATLAGGCASRAESGGPPNVVVRMETSRGDMLIALESARAPITTANFLAYADKGFYDNTLIHRVAHKPATATTPARRFVIQGGGYGEDWVERKAGPPIKNEWSTSGLLNLRGTIAMARDEGPDTATCQWFINVEDNPKLDTARDITGNAGYAVFGHIISGFDVLDDIASVQTRKREGSDDIEFANIPVEPIVVRSIRRNGP